MEEEKYAIMRNPKGGICCPVIPSVDKELMKTYKKCGYKIIGHISCNEKFIPDYVIFNGD